MELRFAKGSGRYDRLEILRADCPPSAIDCPKQGIIPHDMVHFAVESCLAARGFLGRVAAGEAAAFDMPGQAESNAVERLVEVMQGDAWSGSQTPADEMLTLYAVTCQARACPALPVDAADIERIRALMADLSLRWAEVPVGGVLELRLGADSAG